MQPSMKTNSNFTLKKLISIALLVALSVILKRFLGYNDKVLSVSFGFVPIAVAGMLFGVPGGLIAAMLSDVIGALLFPSGLFNPGFTLVAALSGLSYGYFLSKPSASKQRIILCQALITLFAHLLLNTLLLVPIIGKGFFAILPLRALKNLLFFPVEVFILLKIAEYRKALERITQ
jgi:ECF transporter S component (folate family)